MPGPTDFESVATQTREIVARHAGSEGPLLPILHDIQHAFGHVPPTAVPVIAEALNLSRAEVHGVVSFYHDFRDLPAGRSVLKICRAEACQAMGADALGDAAREALDVDWHGTTRDGAITLEPVFCLGLCACAPAAMAGGRLVGRVNTSRLESLIGEMRP